jgi:hypothetical protein
LPARPSIYFRDGAELAIYRARRIPSRVEGVARRLCVLLVLETGVDIADQICAAAVSMPETNGRRKGKLTVVIVVTYNNLFHFAVFTHLAEEILVERVKVVL